LIVCLEMIPWTRLVLQPYITVFLSQHRSYRLHTRQPFRPRASRGRVLLLQRRLLSSGYVRARVVTPSLTISPRSPVSVLRSPLPCADRRFLLRPAAEPITYSGRPPRPRPRRRSSSAVQPRDVSSILTHSERHPAE